MMWHSQNPSAINYDQNGGHIVKDNIPQALGYIEGDINNDGRVDMEDFALLAANWMTGT